MSLTPAAPAPRPVASGAALTAPERVAVVLSLLEPDAARAVAARFEPAAVDRIVAAYEAMGSPPKPVVLEVMARFVTEMASPHPSVRGGPSRAAALATALSPEAEATEAEAPRLSSIADGAEPAAVWAHVEGLAPDALASLLGRERVAVIAATVPRLSDEKAGALLAALPEETAIAVARHLAGGKSASARTLDAIAESLRVRAATPDAPPPPDPAAQLTALLNRCPQTRQGALLGAVQAADDALGARVEQGLLRFASVPARLPRTAVPLLFREADQATLDTALRYGTERDPASTDYLFSNISQRLAEQIRERVAALPMPDEAEGEAAQATLIGQLLGWVEAGRFALNEPEAA